MPPSVGLDAVVERHVSDEQEGNDQQKARPIARERPALSLPGHGRSPVPFPNGPDLTESARESRRRISGSGRSPALRRLAKSLAEMPLFVDLPASAAHMVASWERVAQPVEHLTFNQRVLGSSPSALTIKIRQLRPFSETAVTGEAASLDRKSPKNDLSKASAGRRLVFFWARAWPKRHSFSRQRPI